MNFQKALFRAQDSFFRNYHKIMSRFELHQASLPFKSEINLILEGCGY